MRVPDALRSQLLGDQLSSVASRMSTLQTEVASGIRIQRPSDDPGGALRATNLRTGLAQVAQYQGTVRDSQTWLKSEDVALGNIQDTVRQIRVVALQGANPLPAEARQTLALQVDTLTKTLMQSANSTDGLQFLFAGHKTMVAPFSGTPGAVVYNGDAGTRNVSIGEGMTLQLNHGGAEVFNMGGAADPSLADLFTTMSSLSTAVKNGDQAGIQTALQDIDKHAARITSLRAETGTRLQQVNLASDRLTQSNLVLTDLLSNTESSDITQALVELKTQENVYQAATYVSSTIGKEGLLQWLH